MAIVEMKRVTLLAMQADRQKLLRILQRSGCVQVTPLEDEDAGAYLSKERLALDTAEEKLGRIRWTLSQLSRFEPKKGMFAGMQMPEAPASEAEAVAAQEDRLMEIVAQVEAYERQANELRGNETRIQMERSQILPWRTLDIPVERIGDTRDTVQFAGSIDKRAREGLESALAGRSVRLDVIGETNDTAYIWLVAHTSEADGVREALKEAGYVQAQFPVAEGTPAEQLDALKAQMDAIIAERAGIEQALSGYAPEIPMLKLLYEVVAEEAAREEAATRFAVTGSSFLMEGWIPAPAAEKVERKLQAAAPDCVIAFRDPLPEEKPPTLLKNNRIVAPFENIVAGFSLPDPRSVDPTAVMMPFFACFFGMMVSDAGYGLVLAIGIPLLIHFVKPKRSTRNLMWVLAIGGIGTVFWGAMYDGWFGESLMPMLISPLEQPLEMMMLCIGVGVLHLFTGLGMGVYMNIKRGQFMDAVYDQLSWVALLFGLVMLFLPATRTIGMILAIAGAATIILMAGRDKPTWPKRIISGLGKMYDVTGWLSDLLSYMRLFGMGLATGVIGMVVNMLVGMMVGRNIVFTIIGILVFVGGHIFNAAINILGAYVHSCRLQYIEFFGKFYEDGGYPFTPLAQTPKYIAIQASEADAAER